MQASICYGDPEIELNLLGSILSSGSREKDGGGRDLQLLSVEFLHARSSRRDAKKC